MADAPSSGTTLCAGRPLERRGHGMARRAGCTIGTARGLDIVATPDGPLYFDGYQGDPEQEPGAMRFRATLQQVYRYRPPASAAASGGHGIIGVQANVWTEQIRTPEHLFYMLLPRELALAEIAWAQPNAQQWPDFEQRLPAQLRWLSANRYAFRIPDVGFAFSDGPVRFAPNADSLESARVLTTSSSVRLVLDAPVTGEIRFTPTERLPARGRRSMSRLCCCGSRQARR